MRYALFILYILFALNGRSQTPKLKEGQAVFTFDFGCFAGSGNWSVLVYDVRHTYDATPNTHWSAGYFHPTNADSVYWQRDSMGSVFGLTIDTIGNIYVAAASIYLYPVVGIAGSGGIYKIDAYDWSVSQFMKTGAYNVYNPSQNLMPNVNTGLGDICYDRRFHQLFVTNFEDGKIYRLDMNGNILSTFDPFTADAGAVGLAQNMERVWAVNVYGTNKANQRLFFSRVVEDGCGFNAPTGPHNQVWSVGLDDVTGNFSGAPTMEIEVPYHADLHEPFSDICFDASGNMYLAERSTCSTFTMAHTARVLRFDLVSGAYTGMQTYYTGDISGHDAAGGIDIGRLYYDVDSFDCEGIIWASSDAIQFGTPNYIYGLTGLPIAGNSDIFGSPTYYKDVNICIDHDEDISASCMPKTSLGDVEIFRTCRADIIPPEEPITPPQEEVKDSCDLVKTIAFPNIITANGDLKNDTLKLLPLCEEGELIVFDRWGNEVYRQKDKNLRWDARNKQKQMVSEGVYYCILRNERINRSWFIHVLK